MVLSHDTKKVVNGSPVFPHTLLQASRGPLTKVTFVTGTRLEAVPPHGLLLSLRWRGQEIIDPTEYRKWDDTLSELEGLVDRMDKPGRDGLSYAGALLTCTVPKREEENPSSHVSAITKQIKETYFSGPFPSRAETVFDEMGSGLLRYYHTRQQERKAEINLIATADQDPYATIHRRLIPRIVHAINNASHNVNTAILLLTGVSLGDGSVTPFVDAIQPDLMTRLVLGWASEPSPEGGVQWKDIIPESMEQLMQSTKWARGLE
ncbi:hypothetical protein M231_06089 [Tremella mesenterica]|uniref:Uncharacterized protein n=1 Tax=Tremella mesenterica TaxID=5217 RepID=A0A4Q1BED6_TREME|nr:hypothetical protein M231_06089 [Tremella mesenterica]